MCDHALFGYENGRKQAELWNNARRVVCSYYRTTDPYGGRARPEYSVALKARGKESTAHIYPGVNHGFHNDTPPHYDEAAANLVWSRTIEFFDAKLAKAACPLS